jgi:hypothetical protein
MPGVKQLYFTGCAGNVTAGKYNDGSHDMRPVLVRRVYEGLVASEKDLSPVPIRDVSWNTVELLPPPRADLQAAKLVEQIANKQGTVVSRSRPSYMLAWLRRLERRVPLVVSRLRVNDIDLLHLPGECFVDYQLRAQKVQPTRFVATAAYGDSGTWYIPTQEEYPLGGYEVSVAFCDPQIDPLLTQAMQTLLS